MVVLGSRESQAQNGDRRHLTTSQRAMIAARLATMGQGARTDLASIEAMSESDAATLLNVSRSSVQRARKILKEGTPEDIAAVEAGEKAVIAKMSIDPRIGRR